MSKRLRKIAKKDLLIFKLIEDPNYRVHESGSIETCIQRNGQPGKVWREAGSSHSPDGYRIVSYQGAKLRAHRIIWAKFYGTLQSKMVINHKDGCKFNNAIENLEMISETENQKHAYRIGCKKVQRGNAKLSWETVDAIRKDRAEGLTIRQLKEKYTVSKTALSYICSGKTYREELRDDAN